MPLVDMRSPVWPHVRANHPAPCADHPRAERAHRRLVWQPLLSVALPRGAIRRRFEERFTARRMAREYLAVYRNLIEFEALRSRKSVARAFR
jgi:hypothetical protein